VQVGMEKVSPVHLYNIETANPLDAGLSGFVVIAQSHISLHAWPEYGEVDIDICSCKEFSQQDAVTFAQEMFQTDDVEMHFVVRGSRSLRPVTPDPERLAQALAARRERQMRGGPLKRRRGQEDAGEQETRKVDGPYEM
jgi:S-adenosylmethionine decarboxylase